MTRLTKVIRSGLIKVVEHSRSLATPDKDVSKAIDWLQHYIDKHAVVGGTITHGGWTYHKRTYKVWQAMLQRCQNASSHAFANYGGRGIDVCDTWQSFEGFFADMGDAPDNKSLDRIDNNKGYSPDNCRWATPTEQAQNRRTTMYVDLDGQRVSLAKACREKGISYSTAMTRIRKGYSMDLVLSESSFMGKRNMGETGKLKAAEVI